MGLCDPGVCCGYCLNWIQTLVQMILNFIQNLVTQIIDTVKGLAQQFMTMIEGIMQNFINSVTELVRDIAQGFYRMVQRMWAQLTFVCISFFWFFFLGVVISGILTLVWLNSGGYREFFVIAQGEGPAAIEAQYKAIWDFYGADLKLPFVTSPVTSTSRHPALEASDDSSATSTSGRDGLFCSTVGLNCAGKLPEPATSSPDAASAVAVVNITQEGWRAMMETNIQIMEAKKHARQAAAEQLKEVREHQMKQFEIDNDKKLKAMEDGKEAIQAQTRHTNFVVLCVMGLFCVALVLLIVFAPVWHNTEQLDMSALLQKAGRFAESLKPLAFALILFVFLALSGAFDDFVVLLPYLKASFGLVAILGFTNLYFPDLFRPIRQSLRIFFRTALK